MIAGYEMFGTYRGKPKGKVAETLQIDRGKDCHLILVVEFNRLPVEFFQLGGYVFSLPLLHDKMLCIVLKPL